MQRTLKVSLVKVGCQSFTDLEAYLLSVQMNWPKTKIQCTWKH